LSDDELSMIGEVDILLHCIGQCKPIGERQSRIGEDGQRIRLPFAKYIIDCEAANQVYEQLSPKVTIPIHSSNERCSFKIARVESLFLQKQIVSKLDSNEIKLQKGEFPSDERITVLRFALWKVWR